MRHVFIVGSKGIPARYGGFETFVEKLTEHAAAEDIQYHVACAVDEQPATWEFTHNGAHCFNVLRKRIGPAQAIFYDLDALKWCIAYIKQHAIRQPVVYVLACRIGPFFEAYVKQIHALGGCVLVNPDGHEWLRAKWPAPVRRYWKLSEGRMVKHADLLVCDSRTIEAYIQREYAKHAPQTAYIAYGADLERSSLADDDPAWREWLAEAGVAPGEYYLVVGRFVPENNYETMIGEFMASASQKHFVLVTGVEDGFLEQLQQRTGFQADPRIKFVGTVFDQQLLKKIRENAFAYLHGHEVGGTNPSLLEALAATRLNLLLDVGFNREVAGDAALYWTKDAGSLRACMTRAEALPEVQAAQLAEASTAVIEQRFSWPYVVRQYETLFQALTEGLEQPAPPSPDPSSPLLSLQDMHRLEKEILVAVVEYCEQHGLRYTPIGGTMLGAVRHKGFIPWDDDIDLGMPRPHYERLLASAQDFEAATGLIIQGLAGVAPQDSPLLKITRPDVLVQERRNRETTNLWIDIMPIDALPEDERQLASVYQKSYRHRLAVGFLSTKPSEGINLPRRILKTLGAPLGHSMKLRTAVSRSLNNLGKRIPYGSTPYVGILTWGLYGVGERVPLEGFEQCDTVEFEGLRLSCMACWDEYLTGIYGDYMQMPPADQQVCHNVTAWYVSKEPGEPLE